MVIFLTQWRIEATSFQEVNVVRMSNFEMVNFLDFVGFSPTVSCLEQGQKKKIFSRSCL